MHECVVCGEQEFEVIDGFYYCLMCQTQSQDYVEEVCEEYNVTVNTSNPGLTSRRHRIKRGKSPAKNDDSECFGIRWTTYDAYNLVMKNQVDALIALGAKQELKTVVMGLWFSYLNTVGVVNIKMSGQKRLNVYPAHRDIQTLLYDRRKLESKIPGIRYKAFKKNDRRFRHWRLTKAGLQLKRRKLVRRKRKDEVEETDASESDTSGTSSYGYLSEISSDSSVSRTKKFKVSLKDFLAWDVRKPKTRGSLMTDIKHMKLSYTISFLYLGLLLLNEQIYLSDLLRWTLEGHVPFYTVAYDLLPSDMKFQCYDTQTFHLPQCPTYETFAMNTGRLAKFLEISELPLKKLEIIAGRLIRDFDLPYMLNGCIQKALGLYPPAMQWGAGYKKMVAIPHYEARAAALIVFILKLFFGLDGKTEVKLSKFALKVKTKQLHSILDNRLPFNYCDWRKHVDRKIYFQCFSGNRRARPEVRPNFYGFDAFNYNDRLAHFYLRQAYKWAPKPSFRNKRKAFNADNFDILCRPFNDINKLFPDWNNAKDFPKPSKFPLTDDCEYYLTNDHPNPETARKLLDGLRKSGDEIRETSIVAFVTSSDDIDRIHSRLLRKKYRSLQRKYQKWLQCKEQYSVIEICKNRFRKRTIDTKEELSNSLLWLLNVFSIQLELSSDLIFKELHNVERVFVKGELHKKIRGDDLRKKW